MKAESRPRRMPPMTPQLAESIAIQALGHLAGEVERIAPFLDSAGVTLDSLRQLAGEPAFLAAVLDYLCANESELLAFCANTATDPAHIDNARQCLAGPPPDWGP